MTGCAMKHILGLQMLDVCKNIKLRKAIIANEHPDFICSLCDYAHNILKGNMKLTAKQKKILSKYKKHLRKLTSKQVSVKQKRSVLQKGAGGFLTALLAPLASTFLLSLLRQVIG